MKIVSLTVKSRKKVERMSMSVPGSHIEGSVSAFFLLQLIC